MKKKIWLALLPLLLAGCLERKMVINSHDPMDLELVRKSVPSVINPGRSYVLAVAVNGASADDIALVSLDILSETTMTKLMSMNLYDDGDKAHPGNGDVIAFDGVYTGQLLWPSTFTGPGTLIFEFSIPGASISPLRISVLSLAVHPPEITSLVCPDALPSGFSGFKTITVTVADSTGLDDILCVLMSGFQNGVVLFSDTLYDNGAGGDLIAGDGVCTLQMDSTYAAGKQGEYELRFHALDKAGLSSAATSRKMIISNSAPTIVKVTMAQQVDRPASGTVTFLIEAQVSDPQGSGDIKWVRLSWKKPDNSYPSASPYLLYDNGLPFDLSKWDYGYRGDVTANDGVYSIRGVFDSGNLLGEYTLGFQAEDLVGNRTEEIFYKVMLIDD
ncbi:hypothetical protein GX408_09205 [bacterium]|nr:hypothetical protein [bacterium]